jgi:hypothetical protein
VTTTDSGSTDDAGFDESGFEDRPLGDQAGADQPHRDAGYDESGFDEAAFEDRTTAEAELLDDGLGSPRPPTRVPGVWKQMPLAVKVLLVGLLLVAAGGIAVLSRSSLAANSDLDGGTVIELIPSDGSNIVQQADIGIVVKSGYTAHLSVNGTSIPQSQLQTVPYATQTQFSFTPGAGKVFTRWPAGKSCVAATYYQVQNGPIHASGQDWCFTVV